MDYKAELYYNPLFNYLDFFRNEELTDCEIVFPGTNLPPIKAHAIVLANSSVWFRNLLRPGKTETFDVYENPMNLMPKVIEFMYSGKLEYSNDQVMALLHISNTYIIPALQERMIAHLNSTVNHDNIYMFADKCYQFGLEKELTEVLVPLFISNFQLLSIQNLTKNLDVCTFCLVLKGLSDTMYNPEKKIDLLDRFIGDW